MAESTDFQKGFEAGFKLGSDAADFKQQIQNFKTAEAAANAAVKASLAARDTASDLEVKVRAQQTLLDQGTKAWEAKRKAERAALDADGESVLAARQAVERREAALPARESAVSSREAAIEARERDVAKLAGEAEATKRKYEVLLEKQRELASA